LNPEDSVVAAEVSKKNDLLRGLSADMVEEKVELTIKEPELSVSPGGKQRRVSFVEE